MFDDPKEALMKMNSQLLAEEETEQIPSETEVMSDEDLPIRPKKDTPTRAEGFGRTVYADEVFDENAAVVPGEGGKKKKAKKEKRKKNKKGKGKKFPLFLLLLAILAWIGWWLK